MLDALVLRLLNSNNAGSAGVTAPTSNVILTEDGLDLMAEDGTDLLTET